MGLLSGIFGSNKTSTSAGGGGGGEGGTGYGGEASATGGEASATGGTLYQNQTIAPSTHISINTDALAMAIEKTSAGQSNAAIESAQIQAAALVTSAQSAANTKALEAKTKGAQMQFFSNIFTDTKKGLTVAAVGLLALYLFKK